MVVYKACIVLALRVHVQSVYIKCRLQIAGNESYQIKIKKQTVQKWVKNEVNFVRDDLGNVIA